MQSCNFGRIFDNMPIVAILRGVSPSEAVDVASAIVEAGINIVEVPFNSPSPEESISKITTALGSRVIVGGGTVCTPKQVEAVAAAGGSLIFSPDTNREVIEATIRFDMTSVPGVMSPTEAFKALAAGARYLKLFPAGQLGSSYVGALRAVLPEYCKLIAVGGVKGSAFGEWLDAGIDGFGVGSELYFAGQSAESAGRKAAVLAERLTKFPRE